LHRTGHRISASSLDRYDDGGYASVDEIGRQRREPIVLTIRVAVLDRHVPAFGISGFAQSFAERSKQARELGGRGAVENPIAGIGCCARAASGQISEDVAAALPTSVMNARRFIRSPRRPGR
jgi:hypothetical protein